MLNSSGGKWMDRFIKEKRIFMFTGYWFNKKTEAQSYQPCNMLSIPLSGYLDMQIRNKKNDKRV